MELVGFHLYVNETPIYLVVHITRLVGSNKAIPSDGYIGSTNVAAT